MTICPIALVVHCVGCPLVKICPLKSVLGDYGKYKPKEEEKEDGEVADESDSTEQS